MGKLKTLVAIGVLSGLMALGYCTSFAGVDYDNPGGGGASFDGDLDGDDLQDSSDNIVGFADDLEVATAAGPAILDEASSNTNPTILPRKETKTAGIGSNAAGVISLISNSTEGMRLNYVGSNVNITYPGGRHGSVLTIDAAGGGILSEPATSTNPTLIPNRAELDTGWSWVSSDVLGAVCGGTASMSISATDAQVPTMLSVGTGTAPITGTRITVPSENDAVTPTIAFGDGDAGFYEQADDQIAIALAGVVRGSFQSTGLIPGTAGSGMVYLNTAASLTNATLIPYQGDYDTGIGGSGSDVVTLCAGDENVLAASELGDAGNNVVVAGDSFNNGSTDDKALGITATLNATEAAGGSDVFSAFDIALTTTDVTGWDNLYMITATDDAATVYSVGIDGSIVSAGSIVPAVKHVASEYMSTGSGAISFTTSYATIDDGTSAFTAMGSNSGFTVTGASGVISPDSAAADGTYLVNWQTSWSGTANTNYNGSITIDNNSTQEAQCESARGFGTGAPIGSMSGVCTVVIAYAGDATDDIFIVMKSDNAGGANATLVNAQLVLTKLKS